MSTWQAGGHHQTVEEAFIWYESASPSIRRRARVSQIESPGRRGASAARMQKSDSGAVERRDCADLTRQLAPHIGDIHYL